MKFNIGDVVILNQEVIKGLPDRIGQMAVIISVLHTSPNYDYDIEFDDHEIDPVRETELIRPTDEIKQYMEYIFTSNKVLYFYDEVTIVKVDYLHKKAEIKFKDSSSLVVDFEKLMPIKINDDTALEEITVSNSEIYKKLLQEKYDVYVRKNADYGNSFEDQFNEYGLLSAIIRLDDKLRRLKQLRNSDAKVKDESIRDTALDLANYADMLVMVLDKSK